MLSPNLCVDAAASPTHNHDKQSEVKIKNLMFLTEFLLNFSQIEIGWAEISLIAALYMGAGKSLALMLASVCVSRGHKSLYSC